MPTMKKRTPVIAKHDFAARRHGPGSVLCDGSCVKHGFRIMGLASSVYDIALTLLHIYGSRHPSKCRPSLTEVFDGRLEKVAASK